MRNSWNTHYLNGVIDGLIICERENPTALKTKLPEMQPEAVDSIGITQPVREQNANSMQHTVNNKQTSSIM